VPVISIMQGRLVPPVEGHFQSFPRGVWEREFDLAANAGLDAIEWIYDEFAADVNPLGTDPGIESVQEHVRRTGVRIRSVCADYFMDRPFVRVEEHEWRRRVESLVWLLDRCRQVGAGRVVLPFVDASRIADQYDFERVIATLREALPGAERSNVELHLETDLPPERFARLLAEFDHPLVRVNFDSGNSASLGYDVREEFATYGARIGSIHIKDRVRGGGTTPLGTGNANFDALFECVEQIHYAGDFVLQVARATAGDEVSWARANREFVLDHLARRAASPKPV
jgi:L-ribulose-5-phosphate 3-epimerase